MFSVSGAARLGAGIDVLCRILQGYIFRIYNSTCMECVACTTQPDYHNA